MPLPDPTLHEWIAVAAASWIFLGALGGFALGFAANKLKKLRPAASPAAAVEPEPECEPFPLPDPLDDWSDADEVMFRWYAEGAR